MLLLTYYHKSFMFSWEVEVLNGAAEAYTAGYWSSDDLVKLVQVIIKNKKIMVGLESGLARLTNPYN